MLATMLEPQSTIGSNEFYILGAILTILDWILNAKEVAEAVFRSGSTIFNAR